MLYWLADFSSTISIFNVFRYLTVRTGGAMFTAAAFVFLFGPWIIDHLRVRQGKGQPIREDGPESHLMTKRGTPMIGGGLMILSGVTVAAVLWANPVNPYAWMALGVTLCLGLMNLTDRFAIGPLMIATGCIGMFSYVVGNFALSEYLRLPFVQGTGEITILCGAVIGAGIGFLNATEPAQG